ncbi:DUF2564 family protein [Halalkalibacter nanhaiisediminis]|uniref:Uncharacterized protein DUF2564 n=1 Tax=Halalkalibacter nanhaiisediminis TaxID=688079 RepID=A0A562QSA7_9BACI|nr:DUF2564 family protein [Halalkalibacter nanhaiisediminis]TWI58976.1 uncharacterized protein DUF2564 [Halalkalibacter nanhaiisediminis]
MANQEHFQSGYNDLKQVEMAIKSAEHMVGQATRSMDEEQLQAATNALQDAKEKLNKAVAYQTGVDDMFLEMSSELIEKADHQLKEAKNNE